jgi:hypothetical protein
VSYYDADPWANHSFNFIDCAECESEFDQQDQEGGNICPACIDKEEGETMSEGEILDEIILATQIDPATYTDGEVLGVIVEILKREKRI